MINEKKLLVVVLMMMLAGSSLFCQIKLKKGEVAPYDGIFFSLNEEKELQERIIKFQFSIKSLELELESEKKIDIMRIEQISEYEKTMNSYKAIIAIQNDLQILNKNAALEFKIYQIGFFLQLGIICGLGMFELGYHLRDYIK